MVKLILVLGVVAALLIAGGVLEVRVHPEAVSDAPDRVLGLVQQPATQERARLVAIEAKRFITRAITRDETQQLQLAAQDVTDDAEALTESLEAEAAEAARTVPRAELLLKSVRRLQDALADRSLDAVAATREETQRAIAAAGEALKGLEAVREEYAARSEHITALAEDLASSVTALGGANEDTAGNVAGTSSESPKPSPTTSSLPLQF